MLRVSALEIYNEVVRDLLRRELQGWFGWGGLDKGLASPADIQPAAAGEGQAGGALDQQGRVPMPPTGAISCKCLAVSSPPSRSF